MTLAIAFTVLAVGLARGLLHALDPDHLMTISALSSHNGAARARRPHRYALLWSLGHGLMIVAVAGLVIVTGQHLPEVIAASAESVVGVILMLTGISVLWSLRQGVISNASAVQTKGWMGLSGAPLLIGFVHGLAGSASLMALIPIALMDPAPRFAFVIVFCLGVLFAMLVFSVLYGRFQNVIGDLSQRYVQVFQGAVGLAAIAFGLFWLVRG